MIYAILCYNNDSTVRGWSKEQDDAILARLDPIHQRLRREGKLVQASRLDGVKSARTLRRGDDGALVTDGPFAETKEQLLGFYVVDCASHDEALAIAEELSGARTGSIYEVRPTLLTVP